MFEAIDDSATPFKPCGVIFASIRLTTVANKCGLLGAERERQREREREREREKEREKEMHIEFRERNCELARSQIAWPSLSNQI